jgi:hypothetical protein
MMARAHTDIPTIVYPVGRRGHAPILDADLLRPGQLIAA